MVRSQPLRGFVFGLLAAGVLLASDGCSKPVHKVELPSGPATIDELWQAPSSERNLFYGPGGPDLAPKDKSYAMLLKDTTGFSPGYDVKDSAGVEWSVKLGTEAQTEVVTSRLLWAIGFHQPPTYYMPAWTLTGAESGAQQPGRFRPTVPTQKVIADWSWYENPFVGTREFGGLIVANLILNNWDWKTSNNKLYAFSEPVNGVRRVFVVRDVGASLGKTSYPVILKWFRLRGFGQGSRNDLPGFESQAFIKSVRNDGRIEFDYRGIYKDVINSVTVADVRWACELYSKLTDAQWSDAFRAGGFTDEQGARYVRKIKEKVAQGLALPVK